MRQKVFSILALLLVAATGAWAEDIDVDGSSRTISSDVSSDYFYMYEGTLTIEKGATVTLSSYFSFDEGSKIYLHGTLQGRVDGDMSGWNDDCAIHIYLNDGAKYTLSGISAPSDACQIYYGYDAATDGNGTVSVKNGSDEVTSSSTGYKSTTYTFTASPNSGYKFKNWTKGAGGEVLGTDASINVTCEQNGQYQVYANFEVNITANAGAVAGEYWSTYYNATQGFTADANTKIYKGKLNGSSLTLTEVTDIAAGQAVILKSTTGTITLTPAASTSSDFTGNDLKGGTTVTSGYDAYTLSRGGEGSGTLGFYKYSGATLGGSKAHLEIPSSSPARGFIGFGDDNTTGIELPALADDEAAEWYSLDGRRLSGKPARKGIYVKDGQKVVIK